MTKYEFEYNHEGKILSLGITKYEFECEIKKNIKCIKHSKYAHIHIYISYVKFYLNFTLLSF
jgi:hypothetical protein